MGDLWVIYFSLNSDVRPLAMQCCVQHLNARVYQTVLLRASYGIRCQVIYERWEIDTEHIVRDIIGKDNAELFVDGNKINNSYFETFICSSFVYKIIGFLWRYINNCLIGNWGVYFALMLRVLATSKCYMFALIPVLCCPSISVVDGRFIGLSERQV